MKYTNSLISIVAAIILVSVGGLAGAGIYSGGAGTAGDPYIISKPADVHELAATSADWGMYFVMTKDIDISQRPGVVTSYGPIGDNITPFSGVFDGGGFCVRGLRQTENQLQGFFGYTSAAAQIMNLGIEDGIIETVLFSGMLVGYNLGTITDCHSSGSVSGSSLDWVSYLGGLVGSNGGTITDCYSTCFVSGVALDIGLVNLLGGLAGENSGTITGSYSSGAVSASADNTINCIGGLVGGGLGTITNCYATGDVMANTIFPPITGTTGLGGLIGCNNGEITDCYSAGYVFVSASPYSSSVGGLVGSNSGTIGERSFWNIETSEMTESAGGTGITTAQMKMLSTFADAPASWDFSGTWQIHDGVTFPYLHIGTGAAAAIEGDLDHDGDVDLEDFVRMANNWLAGT